MSSVSPLLFQIHLHTQVTLQAVADPSETVKATVTFVFGVSTKHWMAAQCAALHAANAAPQDEAEGAEAGDRIG